MADVHAPIQIPNRALFKASEVCELLKVQSYVLRSWEAEFPTLGVAQPSGGPRVYRRGDVEQVVRIRDLLLVEGLTLAGARRKLEDEAPAVIEAPSLDAAVAKKARERIATVKHGLRSLLDLLGEPAASFDASSGAEHSGELELELTPPNEPRDPAPLKTSASARGRVAASVPAQSARGKANSRSSSTASKPARSPQRKGSA